MRPSPLQRHGPRYHAGGRKAGTRLILKPRSLQTAPSEHWSSTGAAVAPETSGSVWRHVWLSAQGCCSTPRSTEETLCQTAMGPGLGADICSIHTVPRV